MIAINTDFMLDAVCLAAFSKSDNSKETLGSILDIYMATKKKKPEILNKDLDVFFEIIRISSPEMQISARKQRSIVSW